MKVTTIARGKERGRILARMFKRIAAGESVASICRSDKNLPRLGTFWRWLQEDPEELARYEVALVMRAHALAEELISISDDVAGDFVQTKDGLEPSPENVQRAKLRVNARQWVISRLLPKEVRRP